MKEYNGHRSWNACNVSLWLNSDVDWYAEWCWMPEEYSLERAVSLLLSRLPAKTQDGAVFKHLAVKLAIESDWEAS